MKRREPTSYIYNAGPQNDNAACTSECERSELSLVKKDHKKRQIKDRIKSSKHEIDETAMNLSGDGVFKRGWINPQNLNVVKACDSWSLDDLYSSALNEEFQNSENIGDEMLVLDSAPLKPALGEKEDILSWAAALLSKSPSARRMLEEAKNQDWRIGLEDLQGPDFHLDVPEKLLVLANHGLSDPALARSPYFTNMMLISLIRALRDVWQEKRYGAFDEDYAPEAVLTLERVRAADLDVISVLVAWEFRSEGYADLWRHLLGSDDGDLAMRFSTYLEREPSSQFTHKALQQTFTQWFKSAARVDACDHETLDYLDSVIENSYEANPFGRKRLTAIALERLSCLPDKTAYLQGFGNTILSDPLYAGMNDEINQSHLMHILYDLRVTYVQSVPFRDANLADKIFPGGLMSDEGSQTRH